MNYNGTFGKISFDNIDIRNVALKDLRESIGYVS
jgi:ABC-type multidrug transport system fused ATPase/permease subunit